MSALPNFRNLGVLLRILVIVDGMSLAAAVLRSAEPLAMVEELMDLSGLVQPILILSLLLLGMANNWLQHLSYGAGIIAVVAFELAVTTGVYAAREAIFNESGGLWRYGVMTLLITAVLIAYFDLRGRALSPSLTEARLQALQARIRPHFLFNSINAVLSLIRQDPKRAELALEDMADLFRVLMADNRQLSTLTREIELCRQYLSLEQLRLGERLRIAWHLDEMPHDALIPPLLLQPLLENAVYHGIEPRSEPGTIDINIYRAGDQVHAVLSNPYREPADHHAGNRMALANIRERLALHFDAEASLATRVDDDSYQVHIVMPYLKAQAVT